MPRKRRGKPINKKTSPADLLRFKAGLEAGLLERVEQEIRQGAPVNHVFKVNYDMPMSLLNLLHCTHPSIHGILAFYRNVLLRS